MDFDEFPFIAHILDVRGAFPKTLDVIHKIFFQALPNTPHFNQHHSFLSFKEFLKKYFAYQVYAFSIKN